MIEKTYNTAYGDIHYWINEQIDNDKYTLVFLPGLTADHRLFDKQVKYFEDKTNVFVWDAPGHAASWPFQLTFTLMDKAKWLHDILGIEGIGKPIIVGQSMGGYVGQAFIEQFPGELKGFISIDSAPLQRQYATFVEIWLLKRMETVYRNYPWKSLLKSGCNRVATSDYGRKLMHDIMMVYDDDRNRYARISGHGFAMLADAMKADLPYKIDCPAMLICGEHDQVGSTKRYNKEWHKRSGININWIAGAGHNSNTDKPEEVNALITEFIDNME